MEKLHNAVRQLITPIEVTNLAGTTQTLDSLVNQMAAGGTIVHSDIPSESTAGSSTPAWVAGIDWHIALCDIIKDLTGNPARPETLEHDLRALLGHEWTEAEYLPRYATEVLEEAHRSAMRAIFPPLFALKAPCPECRTARVVCSKYAGETIYIDALHVHDVFAECRNCNTRWWGMDMLTGLACRVSGGFGSRE